MKQRVVPLKVNSKGEIEVRPKYNEYVSGFEVKNGKLSVVFMELDSQDEVETLDNDDYNNFLDNLE